MTNCHVNNLYGLAMSQKLPYDGFDWTNDTQTAEHVLNYKAGDEGYILELDLEYPKELDDLHCDHPLAPENITVSTDMLSEFSEDIQKRDHDGTNCD